MIRKFDEFNSKIKFLLNLDTDTQVANELNISKTSYASMKRNNNIPYEKVIKYCKDKCIDINWVINLKNK
jgi:hypothetical protein